MSEDRTISETDAVEEHAATDEEHSHGCFQVSALCCCLTRRRMYLPGRRPRDRKKKNWKTKNAGDPSLRDIMLEEGQQNLGEDYWSTTFVGDLNSTQREAITAGREVSLSPLPPVPLPQGTQSYDKKIQDQHIPVPLDTFSLGKVKENEREKTEKTLHGPGKAQPPREGLDSLSAFSLATPKNNLVGIVSEGVPFAEGKDYLAMPVKENRPNGSPELLSPLLQEVAYEKEQHKGGTCADSMPEGVPPNKRQDDKYVPPQEPQEPTDLELHSTVAANEKKSQEEQNNTSTGSEGVTSLQELLSQPCIKEQQLLEQPPVTHEVEKQVTQGEMNSVFEGEAHKRNRDDGDTLHQEAQQPGERKYPDILDANDEQEQQVLCHLDLVSETSPQKTEHDHQPLHEQEDQLPIIPKVTNFSFQETTNEKKQKEVQDTRNYTPDTILTKGKDHQYVPHQVDRQTAPSENMTIFSLGTTYTTEMQRPAHTDYVPQDSVVYITGQKQPEAQQLVLVQQIKTPHCNITDEKEEQEGLGHAYFGSKGIVCTEEQEHREPVVFEDVSVPTDNISYEKEQQRKLDCGDSGPESTCDKDDQPALYLEAQEPLIKLSSLPLNEPSEEQHIRKDNANAGSLEMPCLGEHQAERNDQGQMLILAPSKEKERIQGQEEQQPTVTPLAGCNTEGAPLEAWHDQKATSITCEEQKHREQLTLGMTCEEHHKKEKQGLSNPAFPCNIKKDEGPM